MAAMHSLSGSPTQARFELREGGGGYRYRELPHLPAVGRFNADVAQHVLKHPADEPVELVTAIGPGASTEPAPAPPPVSDQAPTLEAAAAEDDEPPPPEPFQFQPPPPREPPTAGEEGH